MSDTAGKIIYGPIAGFSQRLTQGQNTASTTYKVAFDLFDINVTDMALINNKNQPERGHNYFI